MPAPATLIGFALIALGLVLTPGPNMVYLTSRLICQGRAAFGITALLFAVPFANDAPRFAGAVYLLWLAWQVIGPGGRSPFQVRNMAIDGPRRLFAMGFLTNLPNPKIAFLYLPLLPRFPHPEHGGVLV